MNRVFPLCLIVSIAAGCATPSQMLVDAEVKRLCAIDGGVKVYETVKLPADKFDKWGNVRIPFKQSASLSDDYYLESESSVLNEGNTKLVRFVSRVLRRFDGKVMGESVHYARSGGDIPGPWHPSSFACPDPAEKPYLESTIFLRKEI
jgi:hypothetical protein